MYEVSLEFRPDDVDGWIGVGEGWLPHEIFGCRRALARKGAGAIGHTATRSRRALAPLVIMEGSVPTAMNATPSVTRLFASASFVVRYPAGFPSFFRC